MECDGICRDNESLSNVSLHLSLGKKVYSLTDWQKPAWSLAYFTGGSLNSSDKPVYKNCPGIFRAAVKLKSGTQSENGECSSSM